VSLAGDIGTVLVVMAGGLLPGAPLAFGVARRARWSLPAALVLSFASALTFAGIAGVSGRVFGFGLTAATYVAAALAVGAGVFGIWWGAKEGHGDDSASEARHRRTGWVGMLLGLVAAGIGAWQRPWFAFTTDTFYHLAAVRSLLATDRPMVTDPLHGTAEQSLDATSGIFHTWLAMLDRVVPMRLEVLFVGVTAFGAAVVVWAMWALARRLSGSAAAATLAAVGFAGLSMYSDFRMFGFPNRISVGLVLIALLALVDLAEDTYRPAAVALGLAGFAALGAHLASAAFVGVVALSLLGWWAVWAFVFRGENGAFSPFARLAVPLGVLALVALPLVVTKLGAVTGSDIVGGAIPLKAQREALWFITDTVLVVRPGTFVGGGAVAFFATAGVAVLAAWSAFRARERSGLPVAAVTSLPLVVLFNPLVASAGVAVAYYAFARVALLMNFIPWVALAWALAGVAREAGGKRIALGALAAAILVSEIVVQYPLARVTWVRIEDQMRFGESYTVYESRDADIRNGWGGALWDVRAEVGDAYPLIAADPETGYYLAGLAPVAVVAAPRSHSPLAIELASGPERRSDMATLTEPSTSAEARRAILEKWDADYVALSPGIENDALAYESMLTQEELLEPVVESRRLVLFRVLPAD